MEPFKYLVCGIRDLKMDHRVMVCMLKNKERVVFSEYPHKFTPFPFWEQYSNPLYGFKVKFMKNEDKNKIQK